MEFTMSRSVPRAGVEPAQPSLAKGFSYIHSRSLCDAWTMS